MVPSWVSKSVFYQIFPDRFYRSAKYRHFGNYAAWGSLPQIHSFSGGNLRGIIEKVPYIHSLGVNAVYLCPIFASGANHRYHTNDYFNVDKILGTNEDFDSLVKALHKRKMRLILDGVFNHCGRGFFAFENILENEKDSPYLDWFHIKGFPLNAYGGEPNYECWWNLPALPKFNTDNKDVREYIMSVGEYWIKRGADGWRLDVPNEINDDSFWQEFRCRIKKCKSDAYIVGEIWEEPERWLKGDQFDGVMNYPVRRAILRSLFNNAQENAEVFCKKLLEIFPEGRFGVPFNLLGGHDNRRLATVAKENQDRHLMALAMLMFLPGTVSIFSGDEIGLCGDKDPDNRRCFPWDSLAERLCQEPYLTIKELIKLRRSKNSLMKGSFHCEPKDGGVVITRECKGERLALYAGFPNSLKINEGSKVLFSKKTANNTVEKDGFAIVR